MPETPNNTQWSHPLRIADLSTKKPTRFELSPESAVLGAIALELGLIGLRKLRFVGTLQAEGKRDWALNATLGATVVQPCGITLDPVTTRIDETVLRRYVQEAGKNDSTEEDETVLDETVDPLGSLVDIGDVMIESLSLNLPLYPRSKGAELGEAVFTQPGQAPMQDRDARPFADLKSLRDKLGKDTD